jgi:hypothetical protein
MSKHSASGIPAAIAAAAARRLAPLPAALLGLLCSGLAAAAADPAAPADTVESAQVMIARISTRGDTNQFEEYATVQDVRGFGCRSSFHLYGRTPQDGSYGLAIEVDWSRVNEVSIRLDQHTVSIDGPMHGISTVEPNHYEDIGHFHFSYASMAAAERMQQAMDLLRRSCHRADGSGA